MAIFVHLFPADELKKIQNQGVKISKIHYQDAEKGVFCMPVIQNFFATHQWAREMMRWNKKNILAAYFRIPDEQDVWFGHYNKGHKKGIASEAVNAFSDAKDQMGFQVIVPRSITSKELTRIKKIPPLGWRFSPTSKGRKPCLCPACLGRGEYGSKKMLEQKLDSCLKDLKQAITSTEQRNALLEISFLLGDHKNLTIKDWPKLVQQVDISDELVVQELVNVLFNLRNDQALKTSLELIKNVSAPIKAWFASCVMYQKGMDGRAFLGNMQEIPEVMAEVKEYEELMLEE